MNLTSDSDQSQTRQETDQSEETEDSRERLFFFKTKHSLKNGLKDLGEMEVRPGSIVFF